jgi:hypothetical protein
MWHEKIADSQYGIPTPKALPAFSADEAEKVARDFGKSLSLPLHSIWFSLIEITREIRKWGDSVSTGTKN